MKTQETKSNQKSDKQSPPPPEDLDEKLIYDAHRTANNYMSSIVNYLKNLFKKNFI